MSSSDAMSIDEGPLWNSDPIERKRNRSPEGNKHSKKQRQSPPRNVEHKEKPSKGSSKSSSRKGNRNKEVKLDNVSSVVRPYMLILKGIPRYKDEKRKWAVPAEWGNPAITKSLGVAGEGLKNTVKVLYGHSGVVGEGSSGVATAKYQDYISAVKAAKVFEANGQGRDAYMEEMKSGRVAGQNPKIFGWLARKEDMEKLRIKKKYWKVVSIEQAMESGLKLAEEIMLLEAIVAGKKKILAEEERKAKQAQQAQRAKEEEGSKYSARSEGKDSASRKPNKQEEEALNNGATVNMSASEVQDKNELTRAVKRRKTNPKPGAKPSIVVSVKEKKKPSPRTSRSPQSGCTSKTQETRKEVEEERSMKQDTPKTHVKDAPLHVEEYTFLNWAAWERKHSATITQAKEETNIFFPAHSVTPEELQDAFTPSPLHRDKKYCALCMEYTHQINEDHPNSTVNSAQMRTYTSCHHILCKECAELTRSEGSSLEAQVCPLCN